MYVHPVMLAHPNPKRVALLGFEDGAIIRELLKHKSVEEVVLLEYDEVLLNMTMKHFPEYYNCTFLGNQKSNCMDDPRISKQRVDLWDVSKEEKEAVETSYDVIIVDEQ
jgi:spermidine synthase